MIFKSQKTTYDEKEKKYRPVWELDTDKRKVTYRENGKEKITPFHTDLISDHLRYVTEYHPQRLQEYVDSGKIVSYLDDVETRAYAVIDAQVEKWKKYDTEYLTVIESGDFVKQAQIENNLESRAKEIAYKTVIYA